MPLYEFYCGKCKAKVELTLTVTDGQKPQACPTCFQNLEKIISLPGPVHPSAANWRRG